MDAADISKERAWDRNIRVIGRVLYSVVVPALTAVCILIDSEPRWAPVQEAEEEFSADQALFT
jgi:hypothetical protein